MNFQPVLPATGLVGWRFLERTLESQQTAFQIAPVIANDAEYFRANIGAVTSAEALVEDRRLLSVALRAFGLGDDIGNTFFVRKILEDGVSRPDALANRLSDSRYKAMSEAFGFGDLPVARTQLSYFADEIIDRFHQVEFETAVGAQDNDMRLALNARRELATLAEDGGGADTLWFRVMGNPPLRQVFEKALGLPSSFGALDIDKQLDVFRRKSGDQVGAAEIAGFRDGDRLDALIRRFLLRSQVDAAAQQPGSIALTLLQSAIVPVSSLG